VIDSPLLVKQLKRYAKSTGACEWERYIYTSKTDNWEQAASDWVTQGIEPFEGCDSYQEQA